MKSATSTNPPCACSSRCKPTVTATSERGTVNGDVSIVDLYENARILRVAGYGDPQMQADSEHFRILVNDDVIETEKPVKLQRGPSVMTANGMNYNNVDPGNEAVRATYAAQIAASDTARQLIQITPAVPTNCA